MEKRHIPQWGLDLSLLGFGAMRLPLHVGSKTAVDQNLAGAMFDRAIAAGLNYVDTAATYHNGVSELLVGKILSGYPRNSFFLADKLPLWTLRSLDEAEKLFQQQLRKCRVKHFDFYLLHGLNAKLYDRVTALGIRDWLREKKEQGLARRIGFSFHDSPELFQTILDNQAWDFAQIQLNYVDWEVGKADRLYALLEERRIPAVIMEPVRGGSLADLPEKAAEPLKTANPRASLASWAIRYAASLPGVMTVLSGMSDMEQVEDNLRTMAEFRPLTEAERKTLKEVAGIYLSSGDIPCTGCRYCVEECPQGVDIPGVFDVYNKRSRRGFALWYAVIPEQARARCCVSCGACGERCPQHIDIPGALRVVAEYAREEARDGSS